MTSNGVLSCAFLAAVSLLSACSDCTGGSATPDAGEPWTDHDQDAAGDDDHEGTEIDGNKLDLLFVIDNSGSMSEQQQVLRENFAAFVSKISGMELYELQIGVTTTHMSAGDLLEPVAKPGHLQSTPQPVPGVERIGHVAVDERGVPIEDDYSPIHALIEAAVDCMAEPDESLLGPTNAEIECGLYGIPSGCSIERAGCGGSERACTAEDLFPDPSTYRSLPKFLRVTDYMSDGSLDEETLKADFACMTMVGTRGSGIEKGLGAAIAATDPQMTGGAPGTEGADPQAPNHGLIRADSQFAVMFVTDENDCTHDGSIDESALCAGRMCEEFNTVAAESYTPLIDPAVLAEQLVENVRATKGNPNFDVSSMLVASVHGNYKRIEDGIPETVGCEDGDVRPFVPSCASTSGVSYSGDRYERFLRAFPDGQIYPAPANPNNPLTGWMCAGDFRPILSSAGPP